MSLNSLLIALQGFGFQLTPVAIAVQGLIEKIQEEQQEQRYGGGGRRRGHQHAPDWRQAQSTRQPAPRDELTYEDVAARWELLDLQRAARPARRAPPAPARAVASARPAVSAPAAAVLPATEVDDVPQGQTLLAEAERLRVQRANDEALALLLLLAEA